MPTKISYKNVHCGFISKILILEMMQMFINRRMGTQIEVYSYSGILPNKQKETNIDNSKILCYLKKARHKRVHVMNDSTYVKSRKKQN